MSLPELLWLCFSNSYLGNLLWPLTTDYAYGTLKSLGTEPLPPLTAAAALGLWLGQLTNLLLGAGLRRGIMARQPQAIQRIPARIRRWAPALCLAILLPVGGPALVLLAGFLTHRLWPAMLLLAALVPLLL